MIHILMALQLTAFCAEGMRQQYEINRLQAALHSPAALLELSIAELSEIKVTNNG